MLEDRLKQIKFSERDCIFIINTKIFIPNFGVNRLLHTVEGKRERIIDDEFEFSQSTTK